MNNRLMQVLVFAICVGGYVPLALAGEATAEYVTLVGPVLAVVILKEHLGEQDQVMKSQNRVLNKIDQNTNGALTQRIKDAVGEALSERE